MRYPNIQRFYRITWGLFEAHNVFVNYEEEKVNLNDAFKQAFLEMMRLVFDKRRGKNGKSSLTVSQRIQSEAEKKAYDPRAIIFVLVSFLLSLRLNSLRDSK